MDDVVSEAAEMESSQRELFRLIRWIKDHSRDWNRICNPEDYTPDVKYISDLVERLYKEKLYTIAFFVIYTNSIVAGIDWAIARTTNECFLDIPIEVLMERFRRNLEIKARERAQKEQPEEEMP